MKNRHSLEVSSILKEEVENLAKDLDLDINSLLSKLIHDFKISKSQNNGCDIWYHNENLKSQLNNNQSITTLYLDTISDSLYDGLYIADSQGYTIDINNAFTRISGINRGEVVGKHLKDLVDKKFFTNSVTLMVLKQKRQVTTMSTILRNNKKVLLTGNPIFNENGEIALVITNVRDITELISLKKKLEDSEKITKQYHQELTFLRNQQINKIDMIGKSNGTKQIKELIYKVAQVDATVLITGETGVGKEVVAREIYKNSPRKNGPFIKVNCAAIPENLLESELFGYEKGAFTGAQNKEKLGMFELANSGTILLDEIGELTIKLQSKLLRVLQEKEVTRLGGTRPIKLDVRVLASTNQKLEEQVKKGIFREDLYYRLNVIPIKVPPLRERREDIPILAHYFLKLFNKKYFKEKKFHISALKILNQYNWPGNIRELENYIERLVIITSDKVITDSHLLNILDNNILTTPNSFNMENLTLEDAVNLVEKELIEKALYKHGSTRKAAKALGVSQPTIVRKSHKLNIKAL